MTVPDGCRKRLLTVIALVNAGAGALALQLGSVADRTTMRADRAMRPADRLKVPPSGFFIAVDRVAEIERHRSTFGRAECRISGT